MSYHLRKSIDLLSPVPEAPERRKRKVFIFINQATVASRKRQVIDWGILMKPN